jgi:hypothetical protein
LFFEGKPKEDFKPKSKVLGANRNLLAFLKDYHFTIDTQNTFPTVLNCFSIRNGSFSDELHEFEKVLNPEMTDAYFTKSIFLARLGSGCLPKRKRTSGSLGKPILKEALIYTESNPHHKKFQELPRYHLISRQRKTSFKYCRS